MELSLEYTNRLPLMPRPGNKPLKYMIKIRLSVHYVSIIRATSLEEPRTYSFADTP